MIHLSQEQRFETAEKLYRYINPTSKMDTPNTAYELTEKWYKEYLVSNSDIPFYEWCIETKQQKSK